MGATTSAMNLRASFGQEPVQSRVIIVVGGIAAALATGGLMWAQTLPPRSWAYPIVIAAWLAIALGIPITVMSSSARAFRALHLRPTRFEVVLGGFDVPFTMSPGLNAVLAMMPTGLLVAQASEAWRDLESDPARAVFAGILSVMTVVILAVAVSMAWMSWQGLLFRLTPEGIIWRNPFGHRVIPWESLAPGGPPRPHLSWATARLTLAVARPELVRQKGWALGSGSKERPALPLQNDIHPWFLADAIRWYVEHPEDRATIGTVAGHERLVSVLIGEQAGTALPQSPMPVTVKAAVWITYGAAAWGLLNSAINIFLAFAFGDELVAAETAMSLEEERLTGEPFGEPLFGGADIAQEWAIGFGIAATLMGAVALLLARRLRRGSNAARFGLLVLSAIALLQWVCGSCVGSPMMGAVGPPDSVVGGLVLGSWMLHQTASFAFAVSLTVLLLLPSTRRFAQN